MKILIRATNWIGDAIISLPAVRAVRTAFPRAEICLLARPWVASVYEGEPCIDRILLLTAAAGLRDYTAKLALARRLREEKFELAVLLPNSFESAFIPWLAGIPRRIGYARDGRSLLLTDAVKRPDAGHERYYYLHLLLRSGLLAELPEVPEIRLARAAEARLRGESLLGQRGIQTPVIGVSPGAAFGTAKRWLPERFAEAAARIAAARNARVVVFGSDAEKALCEQVARAAGGVNLAGSTTLREFIDMTAACSGYLCNDSGAMHLAAALGVPSVTVFGPTNELATGPVSAVAGLLREPVECAPCGKRECPIDHRCMTRVTTDAVVAEGLRLFSVR